MDVVVTGAGGLLGREVVRACRARGLEASGLDRASLDVTDAVAVSDAVRSLGPRAVVHCAAMTNVDACEADPDAATAVNASGAGNVASAAAEVGAEVVAVSTDYVFDGTKGEPYVESDPPNPIQAYGRSKLEGEARVRDRADRHFVVRSAWIYGEGGRNFLSRLPDLVAAGAPITAVTDQLGSPTYAPDLAAAIVDLLGSGAYGTHHVVNEGHCSFAEFCARALRTMGAATEPQPVRLDDLDRPAARPRDTRMVGRAYLAAGFSALPHWTDACERFVAATSKLSR